MSNWSAFILFIPLAWNYIAINGLIDGAGLFYCYDIPSLGFYVLGLILFIKGNWSWFYPLFICANLNRESACFISLSGFLLQLKLSKNLKFFLKNKLKSYFTHFHTSSFVDPYTFCSKLDLSRKPRIIF